MWVQELLRGVAKSTDNAAVRLEIMELGCGPRRLHPKLVEFDKAIENGAIDYKEFAILYVDDEERSLRLAAGAYARVLRMFTARDAQEGLWLLQSYHTQIGVVFSDQNMPGAKGLAFLTRVRELYPKPVRILVSTFGPMVDWIAAQRAIHTGLISSCVIKPWSPTQLEALLKSALEMRLLSELVRELGTVFAPV